MKRHVEKIWKFENFYSRNKYGTDIITDDEWNAAVIYEVVNMGEYFNGGKEISMSPPEYKFALNPESPEDYVDFEGCADGNSDDIFGDTFGRMDAIRNIEKVTEMRIGSGLIVDIAYRVRTKEYVVETTDHATASAKEKWEAAMDYINTVIASPFMTQALFDQAVRDANAKYLIFINTLTSALNNQ